MEPNRITPVTDSQGNLPKPTDVSRVSAQVELSPLALAGISDAEKIVSAQSKAEYEVGTVARKVLQSRAAELKGVDIDIREYLSGYRTKFPKAANERASEARKVFDAFAKDGKRVTEFKGGYHDWITLCRDILGKASNPKGAGKKRKVTDKTMAAISERIKLATAPQSAVIVTEAISQMQQAAGSDWEVALVQQVVGITVRLSQSKQPIFQNLAEKIASPCSDILAHVAATAKAPSEAKPADMVETPEPAEAQDFDKPLTPEEQALMEEMEAEESQQNAA